jgi:hypothetical protein
MFTDNPTEVEEIERKILEAIHGAGTKYNFNHIMSALMNTVVFQMALVCPTCRKNIARKIKRDIPGMVIHAGQLAATARAETPPGNKCH